MGKHVGCQGSCVDSTQELALEKTTVRVEGEGQESWGSQHPREQTVVRKGEALGVTYSDSIAQSLRGALRGSFLSPRDLGPEQVIYLDLDVHMTTLLEGPAAVAAWHKARD